MRLVKQCLTACNLSEDKIGLVELLKLVRHFVELFAIEFFILCYCAISVIFSTMTLSLLKRKKNLNCNKFCEN